MAKQRCWLIGYDITSPRRLRQVARLLEQEAIRLQYSLFVGSWTDQRFDDLWERLGALINHRTDDVRAWPVPSDPLIFASGPWHGDVALLGLRPMGLAAVVSLVQRVGDEAVRSEDSWGDEEKDCDAGLYDVDLDGKI